MVDTAGTGVHCTGSAGRKCDCDWQLIALLVAVAQRALPHHRAQLMLQRVRLMRVQERRKFGYGDRTVCGKSRHRGFDWLIQYRTIRQ